MATKPPRALRLAKRLLKLAQRQELGDFLDVCATFQGICHNPENGQFVKAACCAVTGQVDELDIDGSDACWIGKQTACG